MNIFKLICAAAISAVILIGCGSNGLESDTSSNNNTDVITTNNTIETAAPNIATEPAVTTKQPLITATVLPDSWQIDVPALMQEPELPAGCEITSLTCLLNYYGFNVDKEVMVDTYLDYVLENGTNYTFFVMYIGDPRANGYGCYSPVIVKAASEFLDDQNSHLEAVNISGSSKNDILLIVASGRPVVIWNTLNTSDVYEKRVWTTPDGEEVYWCSLEHCMLLTGYDLNENTVTVCDPLKGVVTYDLTQFFNVYEDMYRQAMTIY